MTAKSASVSIRMPPSVIARFEHLAQRFKLPVAVVLGHSLDEVERLVKEGWRSQVFPPAGDVQIFIRLPRARKRKLDQLTEKAGMTFVELARTAAWAAIVEMESADLQVDWPFIFSPDSLAAGLAASRA